MLRRIFIFLRLRFFLFIVLWLFIENVFFFKRIWEIGVGFKFFRKSCFCFFNILILKFIVFFFVKIKKYILVIYKYFFILEIYVKK